jgi:predicted esterase
MRSLVLIVFALAFLATPLLAQGGEGQPHPEHPLYSPEELKVLAETQKGCAEAFEYKNYTDALTHLRKQLVVLLKAYQKLKDGEIDLGDKTENWTKAIQVGQQGMTPGISTNYYNQACCMSKLGQKDEALEALKKAMEFNYLDVDHMKMDEDLDNIRNDARYQALMDSVNYNDVYVVHTPEGLPEGPVPLIVFLHGRGGNEEKIIEKYKGVADSLKAILVAPRGPLTGGFDRYSWQRNTEEDVAVKKLKATITAVKAEKSIDGTKVFIVGDKQGGKIATLFALMNPDLVAGAVPMNGYWNKYYYVDFLEKAKAAGLKICMIHGKEDPGFARSKDGVKQLEEKGVGVKLVEFEGGKDLPENVTDLVIQALNWMK